MHIFSAKSEAALQVSSMFTTTPVIVGDYEDLVKQLKEELDSLNERSNKIIFKSQSSFTEIRDIEICRQDLNVKHTVVTGLQVQLEHFLSS